MSVFAFAFPSFSNPDIPISTTSVACDDSALSSDTGPVNIEIEWEPNEINLHWYDGVTALNVPSESQSCVYDSGLTPPSPPTKTGYTFRGWRVREKTCGLSTVTLSEDASGRAAIRLSPYQGSLYSSNGGKTYETYGLTVPGQWGASFTYGDVRGVSKCSAKPGNQNNHTWNNDSSNWLATENELNTMGNGQYCWCKVDGFKPTEGDWCPVTSTQWIFIDNRGSNSMCATDCASYCANRVSRFAGARRVAYARY